MTIASWRAAGLTGTLLALAAGATQAAGADEPSRPQTEEARQAAGELLSQIRGELVRALESSGPLRAIVVCKYSAPEISSTISRKYGARVTRVSLQPRNPALGWADAWEQEVLQGFERRAARGEKVEGMEQAAVVSEPAGRFLRYMRALPLAPVCSHCHGSAEQISDAVRAALATEYPHDRAVGTAVGQVRGAVTFKKPL